MTQFLVTIQQNYPMLLFTTLCKFVFRLIYSKLRAKYQCLNISKTADYSVFLTLVDYTFVLITK